MAKVSGKDDVVDLIMAPRDIHILIPESVKVTLQICSYT